MYVNVAKLIHFNQLSRLEIWTIVCKTFNYERYSQQGIDLETETTSQLGSWQVKKMASVPISGEDILIMVTLYILIL